MMTARELLWILANRCYIGDDLDWHTADAITLNLDSKQPDDKELLKDILAWGQLIANGDPANVRDEDKRSCYTCKHQSLCYLKRRIYDAILPGAAWMFEDALRPFMDIFDTLAEICNQYQKQEENV